MTYDQNTDLVLGEGLMLYAEKTEAGSEFDPIAYATSHTLSVNGNTIDTSSKMSGNWQDFLVGQLGWQVTSDSLISKTTGHMSFDTLLDKMIARKGIKIKIGTPKNTTDFALDTTKASLEGQAVITSLDQKSSKGEVCTSSLTLQGKGELKKVAAVPGG